jgi:hypothetical protein
MSHYREDAPDWTDLQGPEQKNEMDIGHGIIFWRRFLSPLRRTEERT